MDVENRRLLAADEPDPVKVFRPDGASPFFLTCDHAGRLVPRALGDLGVSKSEYERHIAWDIGAAAVSRLVSDALDAPLVEQVYSRLVIDCNRDPAVESAMPDMSELTPIPGNVGLGAEDRAMRRDEIFQPYHSRIADLLDLRIAAGKKAVLVAMHSFTPVFKGVARPWHIGVLYNHDPALACILYETDYGIPVHGERRGIPHVEIEIRQDLIGDRAGQQAWAERLVRLLPLALARL
jgi:predicted N-formylglutamate amidohydrolase